MTSLRSKLLIPNFFIALMFIVGIGYIANLQHEIFRQRAENKFQREKDQLHVFIDGMQQQASHFMELLSNKWHFIDSVSARNMDALLDEITPFNKGTLGNFVTVYDMEGNIIARADAPGIFDKPDELQPHILKMKTGPVTRSILALYQDNLLVLELKRLETSYGNIGVMALGHYVHQEKVDEFARMRQIHLILSYNNTPVVFSKNSKLSEEMPESTIQVKFEENFGKESPLVAFLYTDTLKIEAEYWQHFFIVIFVLIALSSMVLFFLWRNVMNTVNTLNEARVSSEKELVWRKQAEEALKKFNTEMESLVQERTKELENEIFKRKRTEETLQRSKALLDATQQLAKVGGWEWEVEKQTMFWTDEIYQIHDFQPNEFAPGSTKHIERGIECYDPEDRPVIMAAFRRCVEKGQSYDFEFPFTTATGRRIRIRTVAEPVMKGDKVVRVVGNIMDITKRKQIEVELEKHRKHLEELVEERTAELEEKNAGLERMNDVFLGREVRVKELRDKIKKLEGEN